MAAGDYGIANSIATARSISVDSVKHAGIVESAAGKVRILKRDEIDAGWDPAADTHLTVWECCQHLIRELDQGGEQAAALLLRKIGRRACGCGQGPGLLPLRHLCQQEAGRWRGGSL